MIAIIDYGAGNLRSVQNAFTLLGVETVTTSSPEAVNAAHGVVLPGVGSFGWAMESIRARGVQEAIVQAASMKPFLGICLGLQLLFEQSEESPGVQGLGIVPGKVIRFADHGLKIPHMGWNRIRYQKQSRLFKGIEDGSYLYFVHSYYPQFACAQDISACVDYGQEAPIALERGNLFATQFHPEKSGDPGLRMLSNFAALCVQEGSC